MSLDLDSYEVAASGGSLEDFFRTEIERAVSAHTADLERVIRVIISSLSDITLNPSMSFSPRVDVSPAHVSVPTPIVDVEVDMQPMVDKLASIERLLQTLISTMTKPVVREVTRDSNGMITHMVERRG